MEIRYRPDKKDSCQTFDVVNFTLVIPSKRAVLDTGRPQLPDVVIVAPAGYLVLVAREGKCTGLGLTLDIPVEDFLENLEKFLPSSRDVARDTFLVHLGNGVDNHVEVEMRLEPEHLDSIVEKVNQCRISNDLMEIEELHDFSIFKVFELRLEFTNWKTLAEVVEEARTTAGQQQGAGAGSCQGGCGTGHMP